MTIPFVNLRPLVAEVQHDAAQDFQEILNAGTFIGGSIVEELEGEIARQLGVKHVIACGSGTAALTLALAARCIGPGHVIAVPPVTFWATYEAAIHTGADVVLVDIDSNDLQMSFDAFRAAHEKHDFTCVILPHLFGWASSRVAEFRTYCAANQIVLIEDAAQAFGVERLVQSGTPDVEPLLANASLATLSFFPAKVIGGCGDGGAVVTNDPNTAEIVRRLANHGRMGHYEHAVVGWNSRMSSMNAAYLLRVLALSEKILRHRQRAFWLYEDLLAPPDGIQLCALPPPDVKGNGYLNVVRVNAPAQVVKLLAAAGVDARQIYPKPISQQPGAIGTRHSTLPNSEDFCHTVVNLPLWYGISDAEIETCAKALLQVVI